MNNTSETTSQQENLDDIVLVDKPRGISSFDVIRILRRKLGVKKMGHAGTLDPLATGLMLIGVGTGTKKLHDLTGLDKTYRVDILLGKKTSTGDMEGEVLDESKVGDVSEDILKEKAQKLVGTLSLPVPAYSAIKQNGVPLYKKARRGEEVEVPVREMKVFRVEFIGYDETEHIVSLEMDVASGVYVRSVAEAYGELLGLPATVSALRRTRIGTYNVEGALVIGDEAKEYSRLKS